jgi:hypothetical protein
MTSSQGAVILALSSAFNSVGRLVAGYVIVHYLYILRITYVFFIYRYLGDRIGDMNVIVLYSWCAGLSCLLMWTFATSFGLLLGFSAVFGFFGGAFITLGKLFF